MIQRRVMNMSHYQILVSAIYKKALKSRIKTINLTYQAQHELETLICLINLTLYQIFKIVSSTLPKYL